MDIYTGIDSNYDGEVFTLIEALLGNDYGLFLILIQGLEESVDYKGLNDIVNKLTKYVEDNGASRDVDIICDNFDTDFRRILLPIIGSSVIGFSRHSMAILNDRKTHGTRLAFEVEGSVGFVFNRLEKSVYLDDKYKKLFNDIIDDNVDTFLLYAGLIFTALAISAKKDSIKEKIERIEFRI